MKRINAIGGVLNKQNFPKMCHLVIKLFSFSSFLYFSLLLIVLFKTFQQASLIPLPFPSDFII